ncbi:hypothetical protein F5B22DRAFT_527141 [Xylaria bambusicola]|uniref:uncharacterized protein n=1 Tax=Xylaria bambusicola TaxID=326684 RepID=UPI0020075F71|nr:uncharacterized protein F5B22DRAFT_527141 [Xylaria bambusicola]KAI0505387.1 hypothetical protein F5B22DRAFT_527141 [Xylaria bambusicola]
MFRSFLTRHARLFVDSALPFLPQSSFAARYARLTTAFLISGVLHYRADQLMGVPNAKSGAVIFFPLHSLGICLEDAVAPMVFAFLPKPVRRITGYLWVLVFFIWSSPVYTYPSARLGIDTAALLPVPTSHRALGNTTDQLKQWRLTGLQRALAHTRLVLHYPIITLPVLSTSTPSYDPTQPSPTFVGLVQPWRWIRTNLKVLLGIWYEFRRWRVGTEP